MGKYCCAFNCTNEERPGSGIRFHRFPFKRQDILKMWVHAVRRDNFKPNVHTVICSQHFTESAYLESSLNKKLLKKDAVPTIFNFSPHLKAHLKGDVEHGRKSLLPGSSLQELDGQNGLPEGVTVVTAIQPQDIHLSQTEPDKCGKEGPAFTFIKTEVTMDDENQQDIQLIQTDPLTFIKTEVTMDDENQQDIQLIQTDPLTLIKTELTTDDENQQDIQLIQTKPDNCGKEGPPLTFIKIEVNTDDKNQLVQQQAQQQEQMAMLADQSALLQEHLQKMQQNNTLNLGLPQFLKFDNTDIKREQIGDEDVLTEDGDEAHSIMNDVDVQIEIKDDPDDPGKGKKKPPKLKKPKPGQVHITTASDGTKLFWCPECHVVYTEKELLEQHLVGHKIERRFICDICGAGLKRKEHLERHKLCHNSKRPFFCLVCNKEFKRKEHLNVHFVVHSGEKTEICTECGKGFSRKDHLQRHSRLHIARRAKEQAQREMAQILKDGSSPSSSSNTVTYRSWGRNITYR